MSEDDITCVEMRQAVVRCDGHTYVRNFPAGFHDLAIADLAEEVGSDKIEASIAAALAYEIGRVESQP